MPEKLILFVCTANQCRSPMAEYLLRDRLGPESAWRVASAGTMAIDGIPASGPALTAMADLGIDATTHRSSGLTHSLVNSACIIVAMTGQHYENIVSRFPEAADRCFLMTGFGDETGDVADPVGLSTDVYRNTRDDINRYLPGLIDYLERYAGD